MFNNSKTKIKKIKKNRENQIKSTELIKKIVYPGKKQINKNISFVVY